jgi:hypothetical protein
METVVLKFASAISLSLAVVLLAPAQTFAKTTTKTVSLAGGAHAKLAGGVHAREWIAPFSTVYAFARFTDDGTTLTINGQGGGFNPGLSYTSFFYGTGSVPRGALACFPPTPNLLTAPQMITAYWLPVTGTHRTLYVQKTGLSYVSLTQVSTMSVRYDSTPTLPLATNLNPGRYWLDSCGLLI